MGMHPGPGELLRLASPVHAAVEEIRHRGVLETDAHAGHFLANGDEVLDVKQVAGGGDAKAADLGVTGVAEILELEPGERGEGQAAGCPTGS